MQYFERQNDSLLFRFNGETVMVSPWGEDSLRTRAALFNELSDNSPALLSPAKSEPVIELGERQAVITNGKIHAVLSLQDWGDELQISYYNQKGELLLQEIPNGGALFLKARRFQSLPGDSFFLTASFLSNPSEKIYGMGQYQQETLNLKGCNLELAHRNSQASIPFYVSSLGYGFLWNNAAVGDVHFGTNTTQWTARSCKQLDYWITAGDTPAEIEEAYANATGKSPMMPEYGLGFWQCKLRYYNQEQVLSIAREYKKRNIPLDVIVIDFYHWPYCGDWRFDEEFFPDPAAMIKELQELGVETMVSIWPAVDFRSENYEEMKQQNMLVKSNSGVDVQMIFHGNNAFMDATNPKTRRYVWEKCKQNYADLGIRTFWLDVAEPEYTSYDFENYRYYSGTVLETGNIYPREYARLFYEGQKENGQDDIVNLIRCAWAGSQRYGALVWSGDIMSTYEDFRKQICAGIHMGLSGIPWWTTDIGGFMTDDVNDPDFQQLLIRWYEFAVYSAVFRMHGDRGPHNIPTLDDRDFGGGYLYTGQSNELWSYGEENYRIMKKYYDIRISMHDYIKQLYDEASENGSPLIRTMFYEFPDDKKCWELQDQYMFGSEYLVAPIFHLNEFEREVYLPAGRWEDTRDGKVYEGGQTVLAAAPIDSIPVFKKIA